MEVQRGVILRSLLLYMLVTLPDEADLRQGEKDGGKRKEKVGQFIGTYIVHERGNSPSPPNALLKRRSWWTNLNFETFKPVEANSLTKPFPNH